MGGHLKNDLRQTRWLVTEPPDQSLIPRTYMMEGEK